jgi:hypothetical protein
MKLCRTVAKQGARTGRVDEMINRNVREHVSVNMLSSEHIELAKRVGRSSPEDLTLGDRNDRRAVAQHSIGSRRLRGRGHYRGHSRDIFACLVIDVEERDEDRLPPFHYNGRFGHFSALRLTSRRTL